MVKLNKEHFYEDREILRFKTPKTQIILINTGSNLRDHLTKLQTRYNNKYNRIPTFTVDKNGNIYQHIDIQSSCNILTLDAFNKQAIVIAVENVGWLQYDNKSEFYTDWSGRIYRGNSVNIPWRGKKHWAIYTDTQIESLIDLVDYLCIEHSIIKNFIGNNVLSDKIQGFKGIFSRSNFSKNHFDLTPAFNFDKFMGNKL